MLLGNQTCKSQGNPHRREPGAANKPSSDCNRAGESAKGVWISSPRPLPKAALPDLTLTCGMVGRALLPDPGARGGRAQEADGEGRWLLVNSLLLLLSSLPLAVGERAGMLEACPALRCSPLPCLPVPKSISSPGGGEGGELLFKALP